MRMTEIIKKKDGDLEAFLAKLKEEERVFRFGMTGSSVKNVKESRTRRKDIARVKTEINRRLREGEKK